jgi:hypothetical protein
MQPDRLLTSPYDTIGIRPASPGSRSLPAVVAAVHGPDHALEHSGPGKSRRIGCRDGTDQRVRPRSRVAVGCHAWRSSLPKS